MENKPTNQRFKKIEVTSLDRAIRYYTILSALNDLKLTEREVQLIAFTAIKGNITHPKNKEEFCELYKSSTATINNMISRLKGIHILLRDNNKIKVNPQVILDFDKNNSILINLVNG